MFAFDWIYCTLRLGLSKDHFSFSAQLDFLSWIIQYVSEYLLINLNKKKYFFSRIKFEMFINRFYDAFTCHVFFLIVVHFCVEKEQTISTFLVTFSAIYRMQNLCSLRKFIFEACSDLALCMLTFYGHWKFINEVMGNTLYDVTCN